MLRPIDEWYEQLPEPEQSCLRFLRAHILAKDPLFTESWKYGMPFFCVHGKMTCYLWLHKKYKQPYLGIVEGARMDDKDLLKEKRARMKILLIDPHKDLPMNKIDKLLTQIIALYKNK